MKIYSKHILLKLILIGFFIQSTALYEAFGQTKPEKLDELLGLYHEYGQFNGSILIAEKGKVIYKKGFGLANMEWNIPNQPNTKHRLGSMTKQFTAMLILQLVEQGKLDLYEKISNYLPNYPKENGNKITIHHLLTHTSGIPNYTSFHNFNQYYRNTYAPKEFTQIFADSVLEFEPGSKFAYCNSGYFLLGVILEEVTGITYEQLLEENILNPLGMNDTGYDHPETILKNRSSGYIRLGNDYSNAGYVDMSIPYASGSMYSSVEDMYLWDQALYGNILLKSESMDKLFRSYIGNAFLGGGYGYGWFINYLSIGSSTDSIQVIEHGGAIDGYNNLISRIPTDKYLTILLNNTGRVNLGELSNAIRGILYDTTYDLPKKSMAFSLFEIIMNQDLATCIKQYEIWKASDSYYIKEMEMNSVGYQLLQLSKVEEAIEVFNINTKEFPQSENVYDSLGEAYMISGNKKLAIENFKKCLKINPNNTNSILMLQRLQSIKKE